MRRTVITLLIVTLIGAGVAHAEQVRQKFGVGVGIGVQRTLNGDVFHAAGTAYGGDLRYGLTDDIEVGLSYAYEYCELSDNIDYYFSPVARDGEYMVDQDNIPFRRLRYGEQPYTENKDWRQIIIKEKNEHINMKFIHQPLELFIKFRSLSESVFNPYLIAGLGIHMWSVVDRETGDKLDVFYFDEYYDSALYAEDPEAYRTAVAGGEWRDFSGTQLDLLFGFGFEIFPISNVGIDLGLRGRFLFVDDFVEQVTDTLKGDVTAMARLNFYYGGVKDSDKDGILDKDDKCPDTPFGAVVDEFGCPVDSDQDGVPDGLDMCPNTPPGAEVDATGCPSDEDRDGVPDGIDECPRTPPGAKVNPQTGCPLDSDKDGVSNYEDACPNTPLGAVVDANGCPFDTDMDGVYDGIDKCPNTPANVDVNEFGCQRSKADSDGDGIPDDRDRCPQTPMGAQVDEFGCAKDTDDDGVPDFKDACPSTPKGALVDANGCQLDGDADGVYDGLDKCPSTLLGAVVDSLGCAIDDDDDGVPNGLDQCPRTPPRAIVDRQGCPKDSDGDGVFDGIDRCPGTPAGMKVDSTGCPDTPILKQGEAITVSINFDVCKWDIKPEESINLQDGLNMLRAFPTMIVEIEGHTDSDPLGPACIERGVDNNIELSLKRAEAVRDWFIDKGIDGMRLRTKGYGATQPVASNDTREGKAKNRRMELRCIEGCPGN